MNEPWNSFRRFLNNRFGKRRVLKIPLNAALSCPNKDGRVGTAGCLFCDAYGSGPVSTFGLPLSEQLARFSAAHPDSLYIAYFQAHANTSAPLARLRELYEQALSFPGVVGLSIATRPDAIAAELLPYLAELNRRTWLTVELGLQSVHERSLALLERNHTYGQFLAMFGQLRQLGIAVVVHLIVGIPGESLDDMLATIAEMNRLRPFAVKFHLLHVLRDTRLHEHYRAGRLQLLERGEYIETLIALLERLHPEIVVQRLTGERERALFVAPSWALEKTSLLNELRTLMQARGAYQGRLWTERGA